MMTFEGNRDQGVTVDLAVNSFVWHSPLTSSLLAALAPRVAAFGFDAIELPLESIGDWDPAEAAELLDRCGLRAAVGAVMPPGRELVAADEATVRHTQDYVVRCLDAAVVVGAKVVSGPVYSSVGRTWRMCAEERGATIAQLRENLQPVAEHAAGLGVHVAVEPLNRYETSLINTAEQAMELLDGLPPEGIGLCLDVYHMNIEEKQLRAALCTGSERLVHLQVSGNDRGAPGSDHIDWPELGTALRDIGYRGMISIESFTPDNLTIAKAASIWRPLAPNQDALAQEGLAFLRPWVEGWLPVGGTKPRHRTKLPEPGVKEG
jgi:D-psicose/D-tagatose/L-ribulose 3-epimerase